MVLQRDFSVIARRAKPDVAIRFPFADRKRYKGERIATVAALPRNDIWVTLPSRTLWCYDYHQRS